MAYHEERPWRERQKGPRSRVRPATALGWLLALGLFVLLAVIELRAAVIIGGLAVLTAAVLLVGRWAQRHHGRGRA